MKDHDTNGIDNGSNEDGASEKLPPLTLTIDVAAYEEYFADSHLSQAEKHELIRALWDIVVGFVDLGFNIHPVQQAVDDKKNSSKKTERRATIKDSINRSYKRRES